MDPQIVLAAYGAAVTALFAAFVGFVYDRSRADARRIDRAETRLDGSLTTIATGITSLAAALNGIQETDREFRGRLESQLTRIETRAARRDP